MIKNGFILLMVVGVFLGGFFALREAGREGAGEGLDPRQITVAQIRTLESAIEESGFVEPLHSTDVRSEISGRIARILVTQGQEVRAGDPLVELDRVNLENDLVEAQRNHQADKLRMLRAKRDFERLKDLRVQQYAQEKEYLDAETDLQLAEIQVEVSGARLEKAIENLSKTTIRAPQTGIIANLDVNEGQVINGATSVNEGTRLMTVHDLDNLYVRLEINELDIAKVSLGMDAEVTFDSIPEVRFKGRVSAIHPFAFNQSNVRVFRIEVVFDPDGRVVRPGISADIRMVTGRAADAVSVSLSAVFVEEDGRFVYILKDNGEFERRAVTTGINNTRWIEIQDGLSAGETVSLVRPGDWKPRRSS